MTPSLLYLLTVLLFATHVYPQIFPPIKPKYGYYPQRNPKGILSSADLILNTMQNSQLRTWGFVIIRCTYANEAKWEAFLTEIKERTLAKPGTNYGPSLASANRLNERLRWTILEDQESLDGASMKVASEKFVEWVETGGREELKENAYTYGTQTMFPRYTLFIYVDAEALEVITVAGSTRHGYRPTLVRADLILDPVEPEDTSMYGDWPFEDEEDDSYLYIKANSGHMIHYFADNLDINDWYDVWDYEQPSVNIPSWKGSTCFQELMARSDGDLKHNEVV